MLSLGSKIISFFQTRKDLSLEIEGISVYKGNWMKGHGCALPPLGILVGPDANQDLIQHEMGHFLQYRKIGFFRFYFLVGIPSLINLNLLKLEKYFWGRHRFIRPHDQLKIEKEATEMAKQYFNQLNNSSDFGKKKI